MTKVYFSPQTGGAYSTKEDVVKSEISRIRVEHRRGSDNWETPPEVFDPLNKEFGFTLDVCASGENAKCSTFFTEEDDGLGQSWTQPESYSSATLRGRILWPPQICWMNPPYSQWQKWVQKASEESTMGATVVALLPSRTDTKAFHRYIWKKPRVELRFVEGRIKFVDAPSSAPFPSMICIFRPPILDLSKTRTADRKRHTDRRLAILDLLGKECVWCGFDDWRGLQIDHINGGGCADIKRFGRPKSMYKYYLNNPDEARAILQILCANCNQIKKYTHDECRIKATPLLEYASDLP